MCVENVCLVFMSVCHLNINATLLQMEERNDTIYGKVKSTTECRYIHCCMHLTIANC